MRLAAPALLAITLAGWLVFPGHTWLQSDTQIYVPILEHLDNPEVLAKDPVAIHPHVSWTLYDETAVLARRWLGLSFEATLQAQQFVTRLGGITGVFLLGTAMGLSIPAALLVSACFALGAVVNGPAVLTFEYEPVPRGFAVQLIFLALGLAAHARWLACGVAAGAALLYHPPTTVPFWFCLALFLLCSAQRKPALPALWGLGGSALLLTAGRVAQHGEREAQPFWGLIDPFLEQVQRHRGMYNWIELWPPEWFWQYPLLLALTMLAWWRLHDRLHGALRWFSLALPVYGLLMVPLQWVLLDQGKWVFIPQFQPARAVLFITAFGVVFGAAAGCLAAARGAVIESAGWFTLVFAIPLNGLVLQLFSRAWFEGSARQRLLAAIGLALAAALLTWASSRVSWSPVIAGVLPWLVLPALVAPSPRLRTPEIQQLSAWAHSATDQGAVFLFADSGRDLAPGIFRAEAKRNLFVDWKSGGQVNLLRSFAVGWKQRWFEQTNECRPPLRTAAYYAGLGIDYLVLRPSTVWSGDPVYENAGYRVFALPR
jgi:hypothetical protein